MENTLENKAIFFAQYWGQKLAVPDTSPAAEVFGTSFINGDVVNNAGNGKYQNCFLTLRPLSSITDEEAIEVAKILTGRDGDFYIHRDAIKGCIVVTGGDFDVYIHFDGILICMDNVLGVDRDNPLKLLQSYQKIQSFSIALPFHDLSVEQQIAYGWVKLTNLKGE